MDRSAERTREGPVRQQATSTPTKREESPSTRPPTCRIDAVAPRRGDAEAPRSLRATGRGFAKCTSEKVRAHRVTCRRPVRIVHKMKAARATTRVERGRWVNDALGGLRRGRVIMIVDIPLDVSPTMRRCGRAPWRRARTTGNGSAEACNRHKPSARSAGPQSARRVSRRGPAACTGPIRSSASTTRRRASRGPNARSPRRPAGRRPGRRRQAECAA